MSDPVARAVEVLNEALDRDPEAVTRLVNLRVDCNERLAAHPAIRAVRHGAGYRLGVLGLLNAALGEGAPGIVGAKGKADRNTGLFLRLERFVEVRRAGVDTLA